VETRNKRTKRLWEASLLRLNFGCSQPYVITNSRVYGRYRGIYDTAEAAIVDAPKGGKIGYDHPDLAQEYRDDVYRQEQPGEFNPKIGFFDYPMVMWLRQLLKPGMRVFDFGGNIGTQYYNYRDYIDYPIDLSWLICEVPEIRQQGEDLARERHSF
jgi:putative methyltransferase (TIGR04325 family)